MDKNETRDPQLGQGEAELNLSLWGREEKVVGLGESRATEGEVGAGMWDGLSKPKAPTAGLCVSHTGWAELESLGWGRPFLGTGCRIHTLLMIFDSPPPP